jgi:nicotinate phosphoribosyltransferase
VSVAKRSPAKATVGGRKNPVRTLAGGRAASETIFVETVPDAGASQRELLVPLITHGTIDQRFLGAGGVVAAREHHALAMAELPDDAFRLSRGEPAIPTVYA